MKLTQLSVKKWRSFRKEVNIEFDDRITVISGPNECGKSTLIEAAVRGLFDRHTARGRGVESLRPWGSLLAPEVVVTFRVGGERYQIKKRFLDQPMSELSRWIGGKWELIAEGDAADRTVLELVGGAMPRSGLSESKHHGIVQALWVPQGSTEFPSAWNAEVTDALEAAIETATETAETNALEQQIRDEHLQRLTRSQGKPRKNSELARAMEELRDVKRNYDEIVRQRIALEEKFGRLKEYQKEIRQIEEDYREAKQRLEDIEEQVKKAEEHRDLRLSMKDQVKQLQNDYDILSKRLTAIQDTQKAIKTARETKGVLETNREQLKSDISHEKAVQKKLTEELGAKRKERGRIESEVSTLRDLLHARDLKHK